MSVIFEVNFHIHVIHYMHGGAKSPGKDKVIDSYWGCHQAVDDIARKISDLQAQGYRLDVYANAYKDKRKEIAQYLYPLPSPCPCHHIDQGSSDKHESR